MRVLFTFILLFVTISIFSQINTSEEIEINYVSINKVDQQVTISWKHYSDTSKIDGYIIYEYANLLGSWGLDPASAVYVGKIDQWTFVYDKVKNGPIRFAVVAYVGTPGSITARSTYKTTHRTMYNNLLYDSCKSEIQIRWTKYIGWDNNINDFKIFDAISGVQIGSVSASDTTFIISNVQTNQNYSYYIVATHSNGIYTSLSNISSIYTKSMNAPAFIEAQSVNVNQNSIAEITFSIDSNTEIHNYQLLYSADPSGSYAVVKEYTNYTSDILTTSEPINSQSSTYYKLQAINNCNSVSTISNIATVIVPEYEFNAQQITLTWLDYLLWQQGIFVYSIYRTIGSEAPVLLNTLTGTTTQYTDNISSLSGQQLPGNICYYIEAISNPAGSGNTYTAKSVSVCVDVASQVYVPKAFTPDGNGLNDEFRPFFAFIPAKFNMVIYNRYGFKVFETQNYVAGWNGILKNNVKAPEGTYIYFITFETTSGKKIEKNGNFTLIYP